MCFFYWSSPYQLWPEMDKNNKILWTCIYQSALARMINTNHLYTIWDMFNENNLIKYAWLKDMNPLLMGIKLWHSIIHNFGWYITMKS